MNTTAKNPCLLFWVFGIVVLFISNASVWGDEGESFNMQLIGKHSLQGPMQMELK